MDVLSLAKAMKAKRSIQQLQHRLGMNGTEQGEDVRGTYANVKSRLEELEKKNPKVTLYNRVSDLEQHTVINLNKHNLHINSILNQSKFNLAELAFDDFGDDSGIDASKSIGHVFDAAGRRVKIANGQTQAEIVTTAENTNTIPQMITVSQSFNGQLTSNKLVDMTNGTLMNTEIVNGKIQLKTIGTIKAGIYKSNAIPIMNSNMSKGITVSASSEYSATYQAWKAFNGTTLDSTDAWITANGQTVGWLKLDLGAGNEKAIAKYTITPRNHTSSLDASPKNWTFEASHTGAFAGEQIILDQQTDITGWSINTKKEFTFTNTMPYRYYRIHITANNGNGSYTAIGEMELMEEDIQNLYVPSGSYESPVLDLGENFKSLRKIEKNGSVLVEYVSLIPAMTSNDNGNIQISASTQYSSTYAPFKAFDGIISGSANRWVTAYNYRTGWLQVQFKSGAKVVKKYSIRCIDGSNIGQAPKDWTFEGSHDRINWTILDQQANQINWSSAEKREFEISNTNAYPYYRINITANNGETAVSITEMELFEKIEYGDVKVYTATSSDNLTFSDWQSINPDGTIASPSARYIKIKVELIGGAEVQEKTVYDFTLTDAVNFEANKQIVFDGSLRLKVNHTESMDLDPSFSESGTLLRKVINKNQFKTIEKLEVK